MLTFTRGEQRFNYRVAGVAIEEGRILIHQGEGDPFWSLPGGRCEFFESAAETLRREMVEETGSAVAVERLLWLVENFFAYAGYRYHELSLYFLMHFPEGAMPRHQEHFESRDGDVRLLFRWLPLAELGTLDLRPTFLTTRLLDLPLTPEAIVHREL